MDDIAEQLAIRDRFLKHIWMRKTPEERVADMDRLQQKATQILQMSPEGSERFMRRNFRARATGDLGSADAS